jgi:hypothetical protein
VKTLLGFKPGTRMATISKTPQALSLLRAHTDTSDMTTVEVRALLKDLSKKPPSEIRTLRNRFKRQNKAEAKVAHHNDARMKRMLNLAERAGRFISSTIRSEPSPPEPTERRSFTVGGLEQLVQVINHFYAPHIPPKRYVMSAIALYDEKDKDNDEDKRHEVWASLTPRYIAALNNNTVMNGNVDHHYANFSDGEDEFYLEEGLIYNITFHNLDFEQEQKKQDRRKAQRARSGEYFPWYFESGTYGGRYTPLAVDLAKLGIYTNFAIDVVEGGVMKVGDTSESKEKLEERRDTKKKLMEERDELLKKWQNERKQPCLYRALEQLGLPADKLDVMRQQFLCRRISVKNLHTFCDKVGIRVKVRDIRETVNSTVIGKKGDIYEVGKTEDHYFAYIEHTSTTAFAFENHTEAIAKSPDDWTTFYRKWKRDPSRGMSSMVLVRKLLNTPGVLTAIGADTVGLYDTDSWSRVDRSAITTLHEPDCRDTHPPRVFMEEGNAHLVEAGDEDSDDVEALVEKAFDRMEDLLHTMKNELLRTTPVDEVEEIVDRTRIKFMRHGFSMKEARSEIRKVVGAATTILAHLDFETTTDGARHKAYCVSVELDHDNTKATFTGPSCVTEVMDWIAQQADRVNHERMKAARQISPYIKWALPTIRILAHNASYEFSQLAGVLDKIDTVEVGGTFYGGRAIYISRAPDDVMMFNGKLWEPPTGDEVCRLNETIDIARGKQCIELLSNMERRTLRQEGNLKWLRAIVMSEATRRVRYEKTQRGRRYAVAQSITTVEGERKRGLSMQGAPREIRAMLCGERCRDFDLENAIPTIMVCKLRGYGVATPQLTDYVTNREAYLAHTSASLKVDRDGAKQAILKVLYGGNVKDPSLTPLRDEMAKIRKVVLQAEGGLHHLHLPHKTFEANERRAFALLTQEWEDEVLMVAVKAVEEQGGVVETLIFDGFHVSGDAAIDLQKVSDRIHEITSTNGGGGVRVKLAEKPLRGMQDDYLNELRGAREDVVMPLVDDEEDLEAYTLEDLEAYALDAQEAMEGVDGEEQKEHGGKRVVRVVVSDSYKYIPHKLSEFTKMFGLKGVRKEVMWHSLMTTQRLREHGGVVTLKELKECQECLRSPGDLEVLLANMREWGCELGRGRYDMLKYSSKYCELDVKVLKMGWAVFSKTVGVSLHLNAFQKMAIAGLGDSFMRDRGCYGETKELGGQMREYHASASVGGRVQCANNEASQFDPHRGRLYEDILSDLCAIRGMLKPGVELTKAHEILLSNFMCDLDAVSLYPSAMKRLGKLGGFLKGSPKVLTPEECNREFLSRCDGFTVTIKVHSVARKYSIRLARLTNEEGGCDWTNDLEDKELEVDRFTLEDLEKHMGVKYTILRGVYYNEGRNPNIKDTIRYMFDERRKLKAAGSPQQAIWKLAMNASYGKNGQKPQEVKVMHIHDLDAFWRSHFHQRPPGRPDRAGRRGRGEDVAGGGVRGV